VVPVRLASRSDINDVLKQTTQSTHRPNTTAFATGADRRRIAFAPVTLAGSVSPIRGCSGRPIDPGWRAEGLISARVTLLGPRYTSPRARLEFYNALQARVRALPGVTGATLATSGVPVGPFNTSWNLIAEASPTGCRLRRDRDA
jgi:hypothetical protein